MSVFSEVRHVQTGKETAFKMGFTGGNKEDVFQEPKCAQVLQLFEITICEYYHKRAMVAQRSGETHLIHDLLVNFTLAVSVT